MIAIAAWTGLKTWRNLQTNRFETIYEISLIIIKCSTWNIEKAVRQGSVWVVLHKKYVFCENAVPLIKLHFENGNKYRIKKCVYDKHKEYLVNNIELLMRTLLIVVFQN